MHNMVELFVPTNITTSRGTVVKGFTTSSETIIADVQPKGLSEYVLAEWGINNIPTDSRVVYYMGFSDTLKIGNRARVDGVMVFEIRGVQVWSSHTEALLVPVQGLSA